MRRPAAGRADERYRPQVVVTYDENGFYGHPDHIQAHRVTMAAIAERRIPAKLYFTAVARSAPPWAWAKCWPRPASRASRRSRRSPTGGGRRVITTVGGFSLRGRPQFASLAAHASQRDKSGGSGCEGGLRDHHRPRELHPGPGLTGAPPPEDDLFAGLRKVGPTSSRLRPGRDAFSHIEGAAPRTHRAPATSNTTIAAISTQNAKPANGAVQDSLKLKRPFDNPTVRRKPTRSGSGEADADDGRPHPPDGYHDDGHHQASDGLGQEQGANRTRSGGNRSSRSTGGSG